MSIYPSLNVEVSSAINTYKKLLIDDDVGRHGFHSITLERCIETLREVSDDKLGADLQDRYLDFKKIDKLIDDWADPPT